MCDEAFRKRWKEDVVIYKKKGKYSCFPSLGKLDDIGIYTFNIFNHFS